MLSIPSEFKKKNKTDEKGCVTRNKARLMAQGYSQIKGVVFGKTFDLVARLEAILLLLGLTCTLNLNYIKWTSRVSS